LCPLHSFPTRRSSDLCFWRSFLRRGSFRRLPAATTLFAVFKRLTTGFRTRRLANLNVTRRREFIKFRRAALITLDTHFCSPFPRSEEHTSELQSRENL